MSHILFIRNEASIPPELREVFSAPELRIVIRQTIGEVQSALERGAFDLAILYADGGEALLKRQLKDIREAKAELFTIVLAPEYDAATEAAAFNEGADLYFSEPFPTRSLSRIIEQATEATAPAEKQAPTPIQYPETPTRNSASTLHTLRDLSHILSFSLDYKAFTQHFILKLRDHISFSRIGIFLENSAKQSLIKNESADHLTCIASIGLPSDLIDCFQLSRQSGIGKEICSEPRILHGQGKTHPPLAGANQTVEKELAILGCSIAIPISDREGTIGIAVLNGPITGRPYSDEELELLYILMEELGLAIRNSRLHSELAQHGQLIENVLHSMSSGAIVCGENLQVLYANDAARRLLGLESDSGEIDFADLPARLAGPVHLAVEKGELPAPFQIAGKNDNNVYRVSIFPFTQKGELVLLPRPTMIIIEDFTTIEANKQTAVDETRLATISIMAERFAHEIRNSLVPLSTHAQLIEKKIKQPKFQASLKNALFQETARIKRFSDQMLYMAQSSQTGSKALHLARLVEDAFDRARGNSGNTEAKIALENHAEDAALHGNEEALAYALEEIFLNSLQAGPEDQEVGVCLRQNNEGILRIQISDSGPGFPEDVVEQATEPFFTTRNTGVGLGLSVASKIVSEHNGYLRVYPRSAEQACDIEIELPILLTAQ